MLAALGVIFGLFPGWGEHVLIGPMVMAVSGSPPPVHLALWHGITAALMLSLATYAVGAVVYLLLDRIRDGLARAEEDLPETESWYHAGLRGLSEMARRTAMVIQDGNMTTYLRRTFLVMAALIWVALIAGTPSWPALRLSGELIDWAIIVVITGSIVMVIRTESRLTAITALGGVGAGIAIIFVVYGAPDVAMTQLFVEILVVVFLAIAMVRLPRTGAVPFSPRNAAVASVLGIGVTITLLMVLGSPLDLTLTEFFEEASYPQALGRNIVNVILVDFRGLDTMGETAVIAFAAIAAYAVLKAGRGALK
jgi:multicomponent Na+:H+ antiporter subunit A